MSENARITLLETEKGQGVVGRFAPSPTGRMHAGNIFAYLCAWLMAKVQGGKIVLRIENLDRERSKTSYIDQVMRDFEFLGLTWDEGPYYQHERDEAYGKVFSKLQGRGLVYPCFCTRADLHSASAPHRGEHYVYPQTCKTLSSEDILERSQLRSPAWRLSVSDESLAFEDAFQGKHRFHLPTDCGDFVVRRFDGSFAYQLAVVVDDYAQGVNSVVRGVDLLDSTPQQMYIQRLLGLPQPNYAHVPLFVDETGRRLAKRNKDAALDALLVNHGYPEAVVGHIAYLAGMIDQDLALRPEELIDVLKIRPLNQWFAAKDCILFQ